jgi:uncharacterized integral membrane protein (TIGR00697 family)
MGIKTRYLDIISALFAVILVVSNIASSAKIVDLGFSIFGIRMAFDGGTLLFPLAYVIGDVLTEVYGFKAARRVIWTGFAALAFAALVFFVLKILPAQTEGEAAAYDSVLGGISSGGIVAASLIAYLAGEFSNSAILSKVKVLMKGRLLWVRTIGSSLVGELLDSLIFVSIASVAGVFPWEIFWSLVLTNYFLKCGIEALVTPITYLTVNFLKKKENVDFYDIAGRT